MHQRIGRRLKLGLRRAARATGLQRLNEARRLRRVPRQECDAVHLRGGSTISIQEILRQVPEHEWRGLEEAVGAFAIPDATGGVNAGDRRAIYALVRHLTPRKVLEVGTHIGASTSHIAQALKLNGLEDDTDLVTVDIHDVNDPVGRPWETYGMRLSPREMIDALEMGPRMTFVTQSSLEYIDATEDRFDLIFLDGDHSAATVYREVAAAARVLRPGGTLLLHDYFPGEAPLWSDGNVVHGPAMAMDRLRSECGDLEIRPLGELPWPTKLGSRTTSLALVLRDDRRQG